MKRAYSQAKMHRSAVSINCVHMCFFYSSVIFGMRTGELHWLPMKSKGGSRGINPLPRTFWQIPSAFVPLGKFQRKMSIREEIDPGPSSSRLVGLLPRKDLDTLPLPPSAYPCSGQAIYPSISDFGLFISWIGPPQATIMQPHLVLCLLDCLRSVILSAGWTCRSSCALTGSKSWQD